MKFKINIERKHLLYLVFFVTIVGGIGLVVGFGGNQPNIMGHSWGEMECGTDMCVDTSTGNVGIGTTSPDSTLHVIGGLCVEASDTGCTAVAGDLVVDKINGKDPDLIGSAVVYRLKASSYQSGATYYSKTVSYNCPAGDAAQTSCTNAGTDSNGNSYCFCSTSGTTATVKAYVHRYRPYDGIHLRLDTCTPSPGGFGYSCSIVSCEMQFQCTQIVDVP